MTAGRDDHRLWETALRMEPSAVSRDSLHRVAVHVVARARVEAAARFSLRVTPGGLGTPDLAPGGHRVRISGAHLFVESDAPGEASVRSTAIAGASLAHLARFAGVDLTAPLDVGHDTPPVGDVEAALELDLAVAADVAGWFGLVAAILDRVVSELPTGAR